MAELGAVGSILQIADVGLRLSTTLLTFAETVASADKIVSAVSKDVSLTSSVLRELAKILDKADRDEAFSDGALDSALAIVKECSDVFADIDRMLIEKLPKLSFQRKEKAPTITMALERFKWPYLQSKMNLLQSNLERLKSSLLVILHVISLARMMGDGPSSADEGQTALIRDLIKSNQEHVRRYDELRHRITDASTVDAGNKVFAANLHEEIISSGPDKCYERELETKLGDIHHFIALFEHLEEEVAKPCYIIGPHSRERIQKQISNVQECETKCLHRVHGEAAVTKVRAKLRPEPVIDSDFSEYQTTPKPVVEERSLSGSLSRFPSGSEINIKRPKPWGVLRDANRDKAILDKDETSASSHAPVQASLTSQHQNSGLMETAYSQDLPRRDMSTASRYPLTNVDTKKLRVSPNSSSMDKLNKDSSIVASDNYGDVGQSAHRSRPSLKSIVNSLRRRGKIEVTPLTPFYRIADSGHHVNPIKQTPQNDAPVVSDTAGSSHSPAGTATLISLAACPCEAVQDSEMLSIKSSDEDLGGVRTLTMAPSPSTGDSRNSLASLEAHTASAVLGSHTANHDSNDGEGYDEMMSTYHDLTSRFNPPRPRSSSTHSTPSEWTYYNPSSLADLSGHDVDAGYQSQEKMLDDLLRLWTPIKIHV